MLCGLTLSAWLNILPKYTVYPSVSSSVQEYSEDASCRDDQVDKKKNIQLMDCFELFTVKETLGKDDEWSVM